MELSCTRHKKLSAADMVVCSHQCDLKNILINQEDDSIGASLPIITNTHI